jgi:hypothetical protein
MFYFAPSNLPLNWLADGLNRGSKVIGIYTSASLVIPFINGRPGIGSTAKPDC